MTCKKNFLIAKLFFKKFQKITCISPFYVLQYKQLKDNKQTHRNVGKQYEDNG